MLMAHSIIANRDGCGHGKTHANESVLPGAGHQGRGGKKTPERTEMVNYG